MEDKNQNHEKNYLEITDKKKLDTFAANLNHEYQLGEPFPHVVIDNLVNNEIIKEMSREFPDLRTLPNALRHSGATDEKLASPRGYACKIDTIQSMLTYLNSSEFIDLLQKITGISEALIPDPHFIGGGLHQTRKNGYLKIHTDFATHPETGLDRRVNLILYLNNNWSDEYGGHLQLFDSEMKECKKKIKPIANRMIIFNTNDFTNHGHPEPLTCPDNETRNSIALYYYSNGRPESELKRNKNQANRTFYKERDGELFRLTYKELAVKVLPTGLLSAIKKVAKKIRIKT